jgi:VWFA-related protein
MRPSYLRAALGGTLCAAMTIGLAAPAALDAQQKTQQNPPVTVPSPPGDQKPQDQFTLNIEVPLVTLDVVVADDRGDPITGLQKSNFRVSEDGVAQPVSNFATPEAPITCVMVVEFGSRGLYGYPVYASNAVNWADVFLAQLRKDDWVGLVSFDMRTRIEVDFTQDKMAVHSYLARMMIPGFRESNVFDAVIETLDNLKDVKGRKAMLLLASGIDTFSKHTMDDMYKRVKQTDVTIFPVGVARFLSFYLDAHGMIGGAGRLDFYQAENQMSEIARLTGGHAYFPVQQGEVPGVMQAVAGMLRSQYSLGYTPTNQARDGKYRKIKVDVVGNDGAPLEVRDQRGKKLKLVVYARQGYVAPKGPMS